VIRVHRIPYSTNVERVALACGHKVVEVEWVDHAAEDRSAVVALREQQLVPVLETDEEVVVDSTAILEWLEARVPEPPLFPRRAARAAEVRLAIDWFDRVWKGPPNELAAGVDAARAGVLREWMAESLGVFEDLLDGRDHLAGDAFGALDCVVFPFLKYSVLGRPEDDDDPFHRVLVETMAVGEGCPRLRAWVHRVDARPRR
jgi:glutathione S-transferase